VTGESPRPPVRLLPVRLLMVRHGETAHNASGRCQGQLDIPMQATGERQIIRLANRLPQQTLDAISAVYSSPLQRARRSAALLLGERRLPIVDVAELMELHYGRQQGWTSAHWPQDLAVAWRSDPWRVTFEDGESLSQLRTRVHQALHRLAEAHAGESVLVSTHGHVIRLLLLEAMGMPQDAFWQLRVPNASAWWISCHRAAASSDPLSGHLSDAPWGVTLDAASRAEHAVTWNSAMAVMADKTMPRGAMGDVERVAVQMAVVQQTVEPAIDHVGLCVFAADHGVTAEGVSAYPSTVTAEMMRNFAQGGAAINVLARAHGITLDVVDVGVNASLDDLPNLVSAKIAPGTHNFRAAAAMSDTMLQQALQVGVERAGAMIRRGVDVLALGEMGIGNTTSAAALLSALTGDPASRTVGAGTGVHGEVLANKRRVVDDALAWHRADWAGLDSMRTAMARTTGLLTGVTAREWLRRVGGLEIAAMAGAAMEVARHPVLLLADGFISTVAILAAAAMLSEAEADRVRFPSPLPASRQVPQSPAQDLLQRLVLSHRSSETGHAVALHALDALRGHLVRPLLDLGMRLGEGSGAAMAVPLLRSAAALMREMATFSDAGVSTALA